MGIAGLLHARGLLSLGLGGLTHTDCFLHLKIKGDMIARNFSFLCTEPPMMMLSVAARTLTRIDIIYSCLTVR